MTDTTGDHPRLGGMTLQVYVPTDALAAARTFYSDLFGTPSQFQPHDDFLEWAPIPGTELWLQVVGVVEAQPLTNRVRFQVDDIHQARKHLARLDVEHTEPIELPEVVAFLDFSDPWGNRLGYYQDLLPSGRQATYPGTSARDPSVFRRVSK